jgi:hypothetical protein
MKKLSLEMLRLTSADVLERSQMKMITGGYGGSGCGSGINQCSFACPCNSSQDWCDQGLCKARPIIKP